METDPIVNSALLDYGVLGMMLFMVIYFAWYQFKRDQSNTDEIKKDLKTSNQKFEELTSRQITLGEKQAALYEKSTNQTILFYSELHKKIDELPDKLKNLNK